MDQKLYPPDVLAGSTQPLQCDCVGAYDPDAPEAVQLSSTINDMLQVRNFSDRCANCFLIAQAPHLREANQNLILATFAAQDGQAVAEAAARRQTEFLSMLAHELRNPIQPIMMANDLIAKISNSHPALPMLQETIKRQLDHLLRLVNDLLDASCVNTGKIAILPRRIAVQEVIGYTVETCLPVVESRRQHLELELPAEPIYIDADLIRLTQVFSNLLLNASKYTPDCGHLIIRVTPARYEVEIAVIDDGAGVPLDIQPRIFDLFVQGPRPGTPSQSGLGIGLALVRSIVELHGGSVRVSSAGSGMGSQFVVILPSAVPSITQA